MDIDQSRHHQHFPIRHLLPACRAVAVVTQCKSRSCATESSNARSATPGGPADVSSKSSPTQTPSTSAYARCSEFSNQVLPPSTTSTPALQSSQSNRSVMSSDSFAAHCPFSKMAHSPTDTTSTLSSEFSRSGVYPSIATPSEGLPAKQASTGESDIEVPKSAKTTTFNAKPSSTDTSGRQSGSGYSSAGATVSLSPPITFQTAIMRDCGSKTPMISPSANSGELTKSYTATAFSRNTASWPYFITGSINQETYKSKILQKWWLTSSEPSAESDSPLCRMALQLIKPTLSRRTSLRNSPSSPETSGQGIRLDLNPIEGYWPLHEWSSS